MRRSLNTEDFDPAWLARQCMREGTRAIAPSIARLIEEGTLPAGTRLPTVRGLARLAKVSPGTMAAAWDRLRLDGFIETRGRGGTFVGDMKTRRGRRPAQFEGWRGIDLANGGADPSLQPSLETALLRGLQTDRLHFQEREYITDALRAAVAPTWPFKPDAWTTAGDGTEAILLAIQAVAEAGRPLAIEEPTSPRLVDVLERLEVSAVPVACDAEGPIPESLERALQQRPTAFIYQPRGHLPLGHTVRSARRNALVALLKNHSDVAIVEDDAIGPLSSTNLSSIGSLLPERTLLVRTYCRAYGIDLRTSVIAGSTELVSRFRKARSHGLGTTSRILQGALAHLLGSGEADELIARARQRYAARRTALIGALRKRGFDIRGSEGLAIWVPVPDEAATIVNLASFGVSAGAGSSCYFARPERDHIRIAISRLPDDERRIAELAGFVAAAAAGERRSEFY